MSVASVAVRRRLAVRRGMGGWHCGKVGESAQFRVERRYQAWGLLASTLERNSVYSYGPATAGPARREGARHRGPAIDRIDHQNAVAGSERAGAGGVGDLQQRVAGCACRH